MLTAATMFATPSIAAPGDQTTHASGRFLVLPDLATNAVEVPDARADSGGNTTRLVPLDQSLLDSLDLTVAGIDVFGPDGILTLGQVNQVALTPNGVSAVAASGAVSDEGDLVGSPATSLLLDVPIPPESRPAVTDLEVRAASIGSTVRITAAGEVGDYRIDGLELTVDSPLIANLSTELTSRVVAAQSRVDDFVTELPAAIGGPASVAGMPNLAVLTTLPSTVEAAGGALIANLDTGTITVDIDALLASQGFDLNDQSPGSELLPLVTRSLSSSLGPAISQVLQQVSSNIMTSFAQLQVRVDGVVTPISDDVRLAVVAPVLADALAPLAVVAANASDDVIAPINDALARILGIRVNVQANAGDFTETALSITLLAADGGQPAHIDLGSASVGVGVEAALTTTSPITSTPPSTAEVLAAGGVAVDVPPEDKDCGDFATWEEANAWFQTYYPAFFDVANLDEDDDGIPCEALTGAPGSDGSSAAVVVVVAAQTATPTTSTRATAPATAVATVALANTGAGDMNKFLVAGAGLLTIGGLTLLLARTPRRSRHL